MKYIVIEGINAAGKSSIIKLLMMDNDIGVKHDSVSYIEEPNRYNHIGCFLRNEILSSKPQYPYELINDLHGELSMYTKTHLFLLCIKESLSYASTKKCEYLIVSRGVISNITYSTMDQKDILNTVQFYNIQKPNLVVFLTVNGEQLKDRLALRTKPYAQNNAPTVVVRDHIQSEVDELLRKQDTMSKLLIDLKGSYLSNTNIVTYDTSSTSIEDIAKNVKNDILHKTL